MTLVIRPATVGDAAELARLLTQLGHPTDAARVEAFWDAWAAEGNVAYVAEGEGCAIEGVLTTHRMLVLHRPKPVGRITSLVVEESRRGRGIGRALMAAAEEALRAAGCGLVEITSNVKRADAHAFYESLGYERTSVRLARTL
jgi:GNAT superfamily N-acetyltransferase